MGSPLDDYTTFTEFYLKKCQKYNDLVFNVLKFRVYYLATKAQTVGFKEEIISVFCCTDIHSLYQLMLEGTLLYTNFSVQC